MVDTRSQYPIARVHEGPIPVFVYAPPAGEPVVIHADADFVVVDKPAGLLSVPGIAPEKQDCLRSRVRAMFPGASGPMTCHRLDLSTSGVMILALNPDTHRNLSRQFEQRKTIKRYIALLGGHLEQDSGEVNCPMRKDMEVRPLMLVDFVQGKPSVTRYRVLERSTFNGRPVTRVEFEPLTGRTHQLRVHAAHPHITTVGTLGQLNEGETPGLGAPIVGDELYGDPSAPPSADRLMLHASMLTVHHPRTGKQMTFSSPDPF